MRCAKYGCDGRIFLKIGLIVVLIWSTVIFTLFIAIDPSFPEENETVDANRIRGLFVHNGRFVEFSRSKKYTREIEIVRRETRVTEEEESAKSEEKSADIGIYLTDLNGDGKNEILAYIRQRWICLRGGLAECSFIILQQDKGYHWTEILNITVAEDSISILPTEHHGYLDLKYTRKILYPVDETTYVIWRFNINYYDAYYSMSEKINYRDRSNNITISHFDRIDKSWKMISDLNIPKH